MITQKYLQTVFHSVFLRQSSDFKVWSSLAADIHPGLYKFSGEDPEQAVGMMLINDSHCGNEAAEVAS